MGTTESVLLDPETDEVGDSSLAQPSHDRNYVTPPGVGTPVHRTRISTESPSSVHHRRRPHPSTDPRGVALRHPPNGGMEPSQPFHLHGLVLGSAKSGKRTLLQRLEGKEPDFSQNSRNPVGHVDARNRDEAGAAIATVARYQVPPNFPTFDATILLHVHASKKVVDQTLYDFVVLLIDPRHDGPKTQKYLHKRLKELVRVLAGKSESGDFSSNQRQKPLCLIVLRNFRDLIQDRREETLISISNLTLWTMDVLQDVPIFMETPPLLQCIDTSLLNCYGLSALHHFIYQAYVARKRYDLQPEWDRIGAAMVQARSTTRVVSYEEYLESTTSPPASRSSIGSRRNMDEDTATTAASSGTPSASRRRSVLPPDVARSRTQSGGSSSTLPSMQQSIDQAKDALEAFLESDSDDEMVSPKQEKEESDDESDENVFLDESSGQGDRTSNVAAPSITTDSNLATNPKVNQESSNDPVNDQVAMDTVDTPKDALKAFLESDSDDENDKIGHPKKEKEESDDESDADFFLDESSGKGDRTSDVAAPSITTASILATDPKANHVPSNDPVDDKVSVDAGVDASSFNDPKDVSPPSSNLLVKDAIANHKNNSVDPIVEPESEMSGKDSPDMDASPVRPTQLLANNHTDDGTHTKVVHSHYAKEHEDESDSEFFIEEDTTNARDENVNDCQPILNDKAPLPSSSEETPLTSPAQDAANGSGVSISDAVVAAIALAREELERTMRQKEVRHEKKKKSRKKEKKSKRGGSGDGNIPL